MQPIETHYNGLRFRSRLEARWAVWFDRMGIKYRYEPEGLELDDGRRWLPDFELPDVGKDGIYVEVKGDSSRLDMSLLAKASYESDRRIIVLGDVPYVKAGQEVIYKGWNPNYMTYDENGETTAAPCIFVYFWSTGTATLLGAEQMGWTFEPEDMIEAVIKVNPKKKITGADKRRAAAYAAARTARFEFGETPKP